MGIFGDILGVFGLGQPDICNVFRATIKSLAEAESGRPKEWRNGAAMAVSAMLEELLRGDVATQETFDTLMKDLKEWHSRAK